MPGRSLHQLTKQRNESTGPLTRSLTQLEQLVQGNAIPEMIQERMDDVEELYKDAQEVQRMIQAGMDDEEEVERELDMWEEIKSRKISAVGSAKRVCSSVAVPETSSTAEATAQRSRVKLPKIELPTFSGKYTDWCTFWDTFNSTVHENTSLSDVERFHYLAASLSSSAAAAIRGLRVTSENYTAAVDILKERFGDKNR